MFFAKRAFGAVLLVAGVLASGCATGPQKIAADDRLWKDTTSVVGVAVAKLPTGQGYKAGAQGLLDVAINNAVSGGLDGHLATTDLSGFNRLADNITAKLLERGLNAKRLPDPVDPAAFAAIKAPKRTASKKTDKRTEEPRVAQADRDYSGLTAAYQIDKLLLVYLDQAGTIRPYYGFIPLGPPAGHAVGKGQLIDLKTHALQWNTPASATVAVSGEWDTPPAYGAVDQALDAAIGEVMRQIGSDLMVQAPAAAPALAGNPAPAAPAAAATSGQ